MLWIQSVIMFKYFKYFKILRGAERTQAWTRPAELVPDTGPPPPPPLQSQVPDVLGTEDEMDLDRKLYPMGHYLSDKATMLEQMFSIIRGEKLKAMLPPVLKVGTSAN